MTPADLADRLQANRTGDGWAACCPAHDDGRASLSIAEGRDGRTLLKCHAGCTAEAITSAMGLSMRDLMPPKPDPGKPRLVKTYDYADHDGRLLFQVCRFEPKTFRQRQPDGKGGWRWKMDGVERVLYHLPEVLKAKAAGRPVYVVEGEKDCDALAALGLTATTNPGGACNWLNGYTATLTGADVVIIPDRDEPGRKHGELVRRELTGKAKSVRVVELPGTGKDAFDFIETRRAAGATAEDVRREVEALADAAEPSGRVEPGPGDDADALQAALFRVLQTKGLSAGEKYDAMAVCVLEALHRRGRFFFHAEHRDFSTAMYFDGERKLLLNIQSDLFLSWLAGFVGINRTERFFQFIVAAVQDEALTGKTTGLMPEAFWASRPGAVYLSNGDGHLVRITAAGVTLGDNGTDDILFPAGDTLRPWKLTDPADPFESCTLFRNLSATAPHGRDLFKLWFCALPSNQRTKPPLVLSGPIGSGKTRLAVGVAELYGLPPRITAITKNGEDDFWTQSNAGGLVTFDNADTKTDWLPDALAAAATDGSREKRMLYTDSARVVQRARAWIAVTSANPTFAADAGLADRLLVVRLARRGAETAESALSNEIAAHRDAGLSWIAQTLARALADAAPVPGGLNRRHPDFAALAVRIGRALGCERQAVNALRAAETDKSLFNIENDEVGAALLEVMSGRDTFNGTAAELLDELKALDPSFEGRLSVKRLGKRLAKLWPHLEAVFSAKRDTGHQNRISYLFGKPVGEYGEFGTAFSENSREKICMETFTKTPSETRHTRQADPTATTTGKLYEAEI